MTDGDIWLDFECDDDGSAAARLLATSGFSAHYGRTGNSGRPWLLILHNGPRNGDCACPDAAFREHSGAELSALTQAVETYHGRIWTAVGAGAAPAGPARNGS
jgi:hypothetical protein